MLLFTIWLILLTSWGSIMARQYMVVDKLFNCSPDSKIVVNYTYSNVSKINYGYCDFMETIEASSNMQVLVDIQFKTPSRSISLLKNPSLNVSRTNFCNFMNTDMTFMPYVRQILYLERFCPFPKKRYLFHKSTIFLKNQLIYPEGCWNIEARMEKQDELFACIRFDIRLLDSSNRITSESIKCK